MDESKSFLTLLNFLYSNLFLVGCLLVSLIAFFVLNGLVFRIHVEGVEGDEHAQVQSFLYDNGIRTLSWRGAVDENLAHLITANFDFVAHATVRMSGNSLIFTLYRTPIVSPIATSDLVSRYDAVITEITVFSGMPSVKVGDVVMKGQTLISATFQAGVEVGEMDEFGRFTYIPITHSGTASGIVRGRVSHSRATVVQIETEISKAAVVLMAEIMNEEQIKRHDTAETFLRSIGGGAYIVEVVISAVMDLIYS